MTYAGRIGAISVRVAAVVASLSVASVGASRGSVSLSLREWKVLVAQVGILAIVKRCVDGSTQRGRACEASDWVRRAGLVVAC